MDKKKLVCLIPVRGGSKRFPRKNMLLLGSAIDKAKACKKIDEVWVSTDNTELKKIAKEKGAMIMDRPAHLATDQATTEDVILHFSYNVMYDYLFLFECTFPLTTKEDVNDFVESFLKTTWTSLISVKKTNDFIWRQEKGTIRVKPPYPFGCSPRTQDYSGTFIEAGGMYLSDREKILSDRARVSGVVNYYQVSQYSIEVDTEMDLRVAEAIRNV